MILIYVCLFNLHALQDAVEYFTGHKAPYRKGYALWKWYINYEDKNADGNKKYKFNICELFNKWYIFMIFTLMLLLTAVITKVMAEYKVSCYFLLLSQQST